MDIMEVPEFAVIGHPNEGKSSVVSTLAEDDSVRVSSVPGETVACRTFPVNIDGRDLIRFIDTPGFQNPGEILDWMRDYMANGGDESRMLRVFCDTHGEDPSFRDDCELFQPLLRNAGIIYVVDGSRPVRNADRSEMEILRLTGMPRMAVINCKEDETGYLDTWKSEFRKHFNAIRVFNACRATYAERISLLEHLKNIDQDREQVLDTVIQTFAHDWEWRNRRTATAICRLLRDCISHSVSRVVMKTVDPAHEKELQNELRDAYNADIRKMESDTHEEIRQLFKHKAYHVILPPDSILISDLFNEKTWQFLGLTKGQIITAGAAAGAAAGAVADVAAHGLTFGIFTGIGGLAGAGMTALRCDRYLSRARLGGISLSGDRIQVGPVNNMQLLYILIDRALIFYRHMILWAHGRRDYADNSGSPGGKQGYTARWDEKSRRRFTDFFRAAQMDNTARADQYQKDLEILLYQMMIRIAEADGRCGISLR